MPKVQIPFTHERKVNRVQLQPVGRVTYIGNRKPTLIFVKTPTDPVGHFHTDKGTCLKYGC